MVSATNCGWIPTRNPAENILALRRAAHPGIVDQQIDWPCGRGHRCGIRHRRICRERPSEDGYARAACEVTIDAGDHNGDGYPDLVIGARAATAGAGTGAAYVVYGGTL